MARFAIAVGITIIIGLAGNACIASAGGKKGAVVELGGLKSSVPMTWKKESPKSRLRMYQFRLPKTQGDTKDAELLIFFFGKGSGGSVDANLARWKGKFIPPPGKTLDKVAKVQKYKVGKASLTHLDVAGTYKYKFPPFAASAVTKYLKNYRMFGVIFANENGPFFITLIGPERTVAHHKIGFDRWLKAFK